MIVSIDINFVKSDDVQDKNEVLKKSYPRYDNGDVENQLTCF